MSSPPDDPFETRLRQELDSTAATVTATTIWSDIAERSRRRDQRRRLAGGLSVLVGVIALGSWFVLGPRSVDEVRLESIAAPTESSPETSARPEVPEPPVPDTGTGPPQARLLLSTGEDLQFTDLDGVPLEVPSWQPTADAGPVSEVTVHPDGSAVAVWHRDCLVEAGSLEDGRDLLIPDVVDGIPTTNGCSGPAVFSPDGTAVAWTSGSEGLGQIHVAAWTPDGVDPSTIAAVGEEPLALDGTRMVGWDDENRLLIRQRRDLGTELFALQVARTETGGAIAVGDFLTPAFDHLDGRVPLDAAGPWILDAGMSFEDDEAGVIEELGIRVFDDLAGFTTGGGTGEPIDPLAIWFDAAAPDRPGEIRVFGTRAGEAYWLGGGDSTLFGPFPIGRDVTAAAVVPGSERIVPTQPPTAVPEVATEGLPATTESPGGTTASTVWCERHLLAAVVTTADGILEAMCDDGSRVPIEEGAYHHPSLGTERLVAMQVDAAGGSPQIVSFDLVTGASQMLAEGSTPAVARSGAIAWVTNGDQVVQLTPGDEQPSPVGPPLPRYGIMRLSWDSGGRWLFVSLGDPGGPLEVVALDTQNPAEGWQPLMTDGADESILAVAGETDTPDAAALLVLDDESALRVAGAIMAEGPRTLPFPRVVGISPVTGIGDTFDASEFFPLIEPVGLTSFDPDDEELVWQPGSNIAWLVGDGRRLWLAGPPGDAVLVDTDVATISVSPALTQE